jgi:hypothetical protein
MSVTASGSRTAPTAKESGVTARFTPASAAVVPLASRTARRYGSEMRSMSSTGVVIGPVPSSEDK